MQWRMVSQHGLQFCVLGGGGARNIAHDEDDVRFLRLRERACSRNSKSNDDKPHNSYFDFHKFELVCYLWLGRVTH